jgi:hypothetical protein
MGGNYDGRHSRQVWLVPGNGATGYIELVAVGGPVLSYP